MVAQVDELGHTARKAVDAAFTVAIEAHTFRADRQGHRLAGLADIHRQRFDPLAPRQLHLATVAIAGQQGAVDAVVLADEIGHEGVARLFIEGARVGDLLNFALVEHRHPVRHGQRLALVVGHVDHGHTQALVDMLDLHLHVFAQLLVERAQRFVHQHQLRLEHQGTGQGHPLLLAARQLAGVALGEGVELDHAQHTLHPLADVGLAEVAHAQRKGQVLGHGHVREQRVVLEHHADVALVRRHVVDRAPGQLDFTGGGGFEAGQHHQAGGLARAGRAKQGEELALADIQVEVFDDQRLAVVALLHTTEADQRFAGCSVRLRLAHACTFLLDDCVGKD
ncbi:hypothetical protein D3C76_929340 [compost metagenome]